MMNFVENLEKAMENQRNIKMEINAGNNSCYSIFIPDEIEVNDGIVTIHIDDSTWEIDLKNISYLEEDGAWVGDGIEVEFY